MADIDTSEIDQLAADLGDAGPLAGRYVTAAVNVTSFNVRDAWREKLAGSTRLSGLPAAVTFELAGFQGFGVSVIKSEIGFDKNRNQGALGNISEYGAPTITGRGFGLASLQENLADFEVGIAKAGVDAAQAMLDGSSASRVAGTLLRGGKLGDR